MERRISAERRKKVMTPRFSVEFQRAVQPLFIVRDPAIAAPGFGGAIVEVGFYCAVSLREL